MARDLVTRRDLARELVVNAATKPLNVAVPASVAVAAFLLDAIWLLPVAVVTYIAMLVATFFDAREAKRVGAETYARARPTDRLARDPAQFARPIAEKLELARAEETRIRQAAAEAPISVAGVTHEVSRLMDELDKLARRAQRIFVYLGHQDEAAVRERLQRLRTATSSDPEIAAANGEAAAALEDQLAVTDTLRRQLSRFDAQMEHMAGSLGAIYGQIVRLSVAEEAAAQVDVAGQVRDLRLEVQAAADAMREVYAEASRDETMRSLPPAD